MIGPSVMRDFFVSTNLPADSQKYLKTLARKKNVLSSPLENGEKQEKTYRFVAAAGRLRAYAGAVFAACAQRSSRSQHRVCRLRHTYPAWGAPHRQHFACGYLRALSVPCYHLLGGYSTSCAAFTPSDHLFIYYLRPLRHFRCLWI